MKGFSVSPRRIAERWVVRWRSTHRGALALDVLGSAWALASSGAISAMAFDLFLASIPLLALLGWSLARVAELHPDELLDATRLFELAPAQVQQVVGDHTHRFGAHVAPLVLAGSLWLASNALHTPMVVLERALDAPRRLWWHRRGISLACILAMLAAVAAGTSLSFSLMGGAPALLRALRYPGAELPSVELTGLWVGGLLLTILVAGFFRVVVRRGPPRRVWPGCLLTMALGSAASVLLGAYVTNISSLAVYYGSLTAVAVFLLWLWLCSAALLLGAVLNACLEARERERTDSSD